MAALALAASCFPAAFVQAAEVEATARGASPQLSSLRLAPSEVRLQGADASQQFLVMGTFSDGLERDLTAQAEFSGSKAGLIRFAAHSRIQPLADGDLVLTARVAGREATSSIAIRGSQEKRPFSFPRDIGSLLTQQGCNNTTCHGAVPGQGGFKLSTNATYPRDDYKWIVEGGKFEVLTAEMEEPPHPRVNSEGSGKESDSAEGHSPGTPRRRAPIRLRLPPVRQDPPVDSVGGSLRRGR